MASLVGPAVHCNDGQGHSYEGDELGEGGTGSCRYRENAGDENVPTVLLLKGHLSTSNY